MMLQDPGSNLHGSLAEGLVGATETFSWFPKYAYYVSKDYN